MAQVKPIKILSDGRLSEIDQNLDDLKLKSFTGQTLIASGGAGEKIVVLADASDSNQNLISVKNTSGSVVSSINEKGNFLAGSISGSSLSVSGNVLLGTGTTDKISVLGQIVTDVDLGGKKIKSLGAPTEPEDAVNKQYLDDAFISGGSNFWLLDGNSIDTEIYPFGVSLGTSNDSDLIFIRNSQPFFSLLEFDSTKLFSVFNNLFLFQFDESINIQSRNSNGFKNLSINTEDTFNSSNSGNLIFKTGNVAGSANSGNIDIITGDRESGERGNINLSSRSLNVSGNVNINGPVVSLSNINVSGGIQASGTISSSSDILTSQNISSTGNLNVSGNVVLGRNSSNNISINGVLQTNLNLGNRRITNLASPEQDQDGATKKYIDDALISIAQLGWDIGGNNLSESSNLGTLNDFDVNFIRNGQQYVKLANINNNGNIILLNELNIFEDISEDNFSTLFLHTISDGFRTKDLTLFTGNPFTNGFSGNLNLYTGDAFGGESGDIVIKSGFGDISRGNLIVDTNIINLSGSVFLGSDSESFISILGRINEDIDLNNYTVNNVATPFLSGQVSNKFYVDSEIQNLQDEAILRDGSQAMTGDLNLDNNKITSLGAPTVSGDATNKDYVDTEIASLRSDSILRDGTQEMTGDLNLDNNKITSLGAPTVSGDATNKNYVDTEISSLRSDSILRDGTQEMTGNLNLDNNKITSLANPTSSGDAANKSYVDSQSSSVNNAKWDKSGNSILSTDVFGSTNNEDVVFVRNSVPKLKIQDQQLEHFSNIRPSSNSSFYLGETDKQYTKIYVKEVNNFDNTNFVIKQSNTEALTINSSDIIVDRNLVVQAKVSNNETKLLNIKNVSGDSVASIDEDGDMIVNNLQVNGVETVVGTMTAQSNLQVQGSLSVSGSVYLGNDSTDGIFFIGRSESNLDMNSNKITSLASPTVSGDATNKNYVDTEISSLRSDAILRDGTQAMTSNLNLGGFKITSLSTPSSTGDATNKNYVDTSVSNLSASSMLLNGSQSMTANMNLGGFKITSLAAPSVSGDATNKDYVDSEISGLRASSMLLNGSQSMTANMNLGGFKITSLAAPSVSGDATNKNYVDTSVSNLSASSMLLNGSQSMTADMNLGGFKITSLAAPSASGDATNKDYVDTSVSNLSASSMLLNGSQSMTANMNLGGFKITSLAAPSVSGDATNKDYVDTGISSLRTDSILRNGTQGMLADLNLNNNKITSLAAPSVSGDATNKDYVDTSISNLSASSMLLNGSQSMTANMNLGGFKITSLADATSSGDAVNKNQLDLQNTNLTNYINDVAAAVSAVEDLKIPLTASGNIAEGAPVFIVQTANETVKEASADGSSLSRIIGFAESSITDGTSGNITIAGFAVIPSSQIDGGALTVGAPVFLSSNAGKITSTAPTTTGSRVHQVGVAVSPTKLIIDIKQGITIT